MSSMKTKHLLWGAIIGLLIICPLGAAFLMAMGSELPRPLPPLTPIVSPTVIDWLLTPVMSPEQPNAATPAATPLFATHAVIETQFAATAIALTSQDAKLR
jgi:hypothetical protein